MFALNQRAQESAPFELLVAVIVMIFVIMIGLNATQLLMREQCKGQIESKLQDFKIALERTVKSKTKANVNFNYPFCLGQEKNTKVTIESTENKRMCAAFCGGAQLSCTLLKFVVKEGESFFECLTISPSTDFSISGCDASELGEGQFDAIDLKETDNGIKPDNYVLVSRFSALSDVPKVCAYKRKK